LTVIPFSPYLLLRCSCLNLFIKEKLMKRLLGVCLFVVLSVGVAKATVHSSGIDSGPETHTLNFVAPAVPSTANVPGDAPIGSIVYQTSDNTFYGLAIQGTSSAWAAMSVPSTGSFVPTGTILPFAGSAAPAGYLLCDGSSQVRTTYSALFTVIGTTYGSIDGTHFNLPNCQGVFLRGAGSQTISSITYSGTLGTAQGDQMQGHIHGFSAAITPTWSSATLAAGSSVASMNNGNTGGPASDGTNGTPRVGSETRPANLTITYIIKY